MLHWPKLSNQFANRFQAIRYHPERADFPCRFGHGYSDPLGVDNIKTNKQYFRHARSVLSYAGLCAARFTFSQRNPRYCEPAAGRSILTNAIGVRVPKIPGSLSERFHL
jgi:hypothetical protein